MIRVFDDATALSRGCAQDFVDTANTAIAERGRFAVALSGGHTPEAAFRLLATPEFSSQLDWSKVHVFWGDERNIPNTDPSSNEHMAREAFLNSVPIPAGNIHPMFNGGTNADAASAYEALLHSFFGEGPLFDMVMLGMGPDGHTASLFPGADLSSEALVVPAWTDVWSVRDRITLTVKAISLARKVAVAAASDDKAEMVKAIAEDHADYPLTHVLSKCTNLTWMLDKGAARLLSSNAV